MSVVPVTAAVKVVVPPAGRVAVPGLTTTTTPCAAPPFPTWTTLDPRPFFVETAKFTSSGVAVAAVVALGECSAVT